jgi:hypothetical protein
MIIQALVAAILMKGFRKGTSCWCPILVVWCRSGSFPPFFDRKFVGSASRGLGLAVSCADTTLLRKKGSSAVTLAVTVLFLCVFTKLILVLVLVLVLV